MRKPVLLAAMAVLSLVPAARAQVVIEDQADTFMDSRAQHLERMAGHPEKWWGGDVSDRPGSTTLNDPHEFNPTMSLATPGSDSASTSPAIPSNPNTVKPLFSFEEMSAADGSGPAAQAPVDFSNPTDIEQAARQMGSQALETLFGNNATGQPAQQPPQQPGLEQPIGAQQPAPTLVRQDTIPLTAAPPQFVPADPKPAAPIAPPPTQDEAGATTINPADAPALTDTGAAAPTTTEIPPLEETLAPAAPAPADGAAPALTP